MRVGKPWGKWSAAASLVAGLALGQGARHRPPCAASERLVGGWCYPPTHATTPRVPRVRCVGGQLWTGEACECPASRPRFDGAARRCVSAQGAGSATGPVMQGDTAGDGVDEDGDGLDCEAAGAGGVYWVYCPAGVSWEAARRVCAQGGYQLASVRGLEEHEVVVALLSRTPGGQGANVWLGLSDQNPSGAWGWTDAAPLAWTRWFAGEPNNAPPGEHCAELFQNQQARYWAWNDNACDSTHHGALCAARCPPGQSYNPADRSCAMRDALQRPRTRGPSGPSAVYRNDFENTSDRLAEWSPRTVDVTPAGARRFLGQFGNAEVTLRLGSLPPHRRVRVEFDLYVLKSWDGEDPQWGGERFSVGVEGAEPALLTGFSNTESTPQLYPGTQPGRHPARTGARENNLFGYSFGGDAVYRLSVEFAHEGPGLPLVVRARGLQDRTADGTLSLDDESWGLDNVLVTTIP